MMNTDDLEPYTFPTPSEWTELLQGMESAGGNVHLREANAARLRIATSAHSNAVALYVADRQLQAARAAEAAAAIREDSAKRTAWSLTAATWVLALATAGLIWATIANGG